MIGESLPPGADGTYGFHALLDGLVGTLLVTEVIDNGGAGYFVKLAFTDADGASLDAECRYGPEDHGLVEDPVGTAGIAEDCVVPGGAVELEVTAHLGVLLDVTVRTG